MFPRHAHGTTSLACTPRRQILPFQSAVPQIWDRKHTFPVSWFPQQTAEHVLRRRNTASPVMHFRESWTAVLLLHLRTHMMYNPVRTNSQAILVQEQRNSRCRVTLMIHD